MMNAESKAPSSSEEGVGGGGPTREILLRRAAEMRKNPTEPEKRLWMVLRGSRLAGYKFRRQAVIGWRIVDFFCPEKGLVIEIDGGTHDRDVDLRRDFELERNTGFAVLRFTNEDVMRNIEGVLTALSLALQNRADRWAGRDSTTPQPPPLKRRGSSEVVHSTLEEGVGGGGL
jgi:very-short-patch-repair endonuclease